MENKIKYLLLILYLSFFSSLSSQNNKTNNFTIERKIERLNSYADKISKNNDIGKKKYVSQFFKLLPNDFTIFYKIYGNVKDNSIHTLNPNYTLYTILPKLEKFIPVNEYCRKMIEVGINGHWEADEIGIMQHHIQKIVPKNITLSIDILKSKNDKEIKSFWRFFYDGPHPDNYQKTYEELYSKINKINPKIAKLMKQAFKELLAEDDGHGR